MWRKEMRAVLEKSKMHSDPEGAAELLENYFRRQQHAIVAYSGGVDSALLAFAAHRALGNQMVAVLADSPSLSRREYHSALGFAQNHGIPLQILRTREMEDPNYQANQADRCYYCKRALFEKIEILRKQLVGFDENLSWPVFYGVNRDDLGDYRPGIQAAREASIQAPYVELGFTKRTIRAICAYFNLEIADKPAMPCMASRIAYGEEVTLEKLDQVEKAEDFLYDLGFRVLRVRHHGDTARIEVPPQDFEAVLKHQERVRQKFHALGFTYVSLDLDGFKSGSLNAVLNST
jgi:uncharacterized protein